LLNLLEVQAKAAEVIFSFYLPVNFLGFFTAEAGFNDFFLGFTDEDPAGFIGEYLNAIS